MLKLAQKQKTSNQIIRVEEKKIKWFVKRIKSNGLLDLENLEKSVIPLIPILPGQD